MSTYRKIHGRSIQAVTTDPTESVAEGQVWYNTTSDTFKSVVSLEAFSSGSPLATARRLLGGAGTQTAGLAFGGRTAPNASVASTEEYNGSGYSAGGDLGTARFGIGFAGTQTAALGFGGATPSKNETEEYNGTSWSEQNNLGTARYSGGSFGIQTAAVMATGSTYPTTPNATEHYDGTSWTASNNVGSARYNLAAAGTQTAGLIFGGQDPTVGKTEEYNGTTWSEQNDMNTARAGLGGSGTQTAALAFGAPNAAEKYDGTSWSTSPATMATARGSIGGLGTQSAALAFGGSPALSATEEFNISANVITAAAWAAGPALGTGRYSGVSGGTTTAAILAGGGYPRDKNETELYDGTSWSEVNNMNSGRGRLSGTGTPSSAVGAGGYTPSSYSSAAEQWDGTNWSNITSLPASRQYMGSIGASGSAALFIGGNSSGSAPSPAYQVNETLYWNGSSWATGGNYPSTVWNPRGFGTTSAGISCGGNNGPNTSSNSYNGSSWTSGPSLNIARDNCGASGATDGDGLIYGGGSDLTAEKWDGTSFATSASFANSHNGGGSNQNGSSSTAMIFGDAPAGTAFEEFTAETTSLNVKTLTQS